MEAVTTVCSEVTRYSTPKRKVLGDISNEIVESPISPMANLRLLTKVATSPEKTHLSQTIGSCLDCEQESNSPCLDSTSEDRCAIPIKKKFGYGYVRKTKSLGFLCDKFLKLFPLDIAKGQSIVISLNHVANELGVEKRRIYDIINIVECLAMSNKIGTDTYSWLGNQNLSRTMGLFNEYARHIGLNNVVKAAQEGETLKSGVYRDLFTDSSLHFKSLTTCLLDERRIGVLCQKFVMLLLVSFQQNLMVSLDAAAAILVGEPELGKTRYRRLYDIANILQTLDIIRRIEPNSSTACFKKPVYMYSGPPIERTSFTLCCCNGSCTTVANHVRNQTEERFTAVEMELKSSDSSSDCPSPKRLLITTSKGKPAAKKRLMFRSEMKCNKSNVIHKSFDLVCKPVTPKPVALSTKFQLEPGALYKAVKTVTGVQLIKLD